jgi:hypothetical protein
MGRSVAFGATVVPGEGYTTLTVLTGEAVTTFALVVGLYLFIGFRQLRPFTPAMSSVSLCGDGAFGGTNIRHEHKSSPHLRSGTHIRTMGGMVDLLSRSAHRHSGGHPGVQLSGEANRSSEALSFRE